MKIKHFLITLLLLAGIQFSSNAQLSLGAGLGYGTDIEELAIRARGVYAISGPWRAAADFDFYLDGEKNISFWEFNVNGHYLFLNNEKLRAYALPGLKFYHVKIDYDSNLPGFTNVSNTDTGVNLGAGLEVPLGPVDFFGEAKFSLAGSEQLFIAAGIQIPLGGR